MKVKIGFCLTVFALVAIFLFSSKESQHSHDKAIASEPKEQKYNAKTNSVQGTQVQSGQTNIAQHTGNDVLPALKAKNSVSFSTTQDDDSIQQISFSESSTIIPLPNIDPVFNDYAMRYQADLSPLTNLHVGEQVILKWMNKHIEATLKASTFSANGNQHLAFKLGNGSNLTHMTLTYSATGIRGKVNVDGTRYHIRAIDDQILLMSHQEYIKIHGLQDHTEKER
ncbi:hypothetical protein [Pseudoalteromonas byunsanensis]|uniref:Uncharacterized protein n=1 Tax=Pseudoalteromonas byunsanensis TaxID=327939 RepID=A0A1S1N671_9GAMM|nr:hypothetical protein [Pseudoalteromonas byunsanensis]OHU93746.1 hypothetical protein BIW53_18590 [Pseudoalteromonas byunsanensis]